MIGNRLEQDIVSVMQDDLSSMYSINEISRRLKKPYPYIHKKSNLLLDEGVLNKTIIGRAHCCHINLTNEKARMLMALNEIRKKEEFIAKEKSHIVLFQEVERLILKFNFITIIYYKRSVFFITPEVGQRKNVLEDSILTRDYSLIFMTKEQFKNRLENDADLMKYHLVLYNAYRYLEMISEMSEIILLKSFVKK
jgi:hypothetical protein